MKTSKNNKYQFCYYEPKHFKELLKLSLKFTYEHNPEKRLKTKAEKKKQRKAESKYLKQNSSSKYYRYYLCFKGTTLIGYSWFGQQDSDRKKGFIDELYVKPKHRKKGIATVLLKETINWIKEKDCSLIELDVKIQNKGAVRLYQKIGFKEQKPKWH